MQKSLYFLAIVLLLLYPDLQLQTVLPALPAM